MYSEPKGLGGAAHLIVVRCELEIHPLVTGKQSASQVDRVEGSKQCGEGVGRSLKNMRVDRNQTERIYRLQHLGSSLGYCCVFKAETDPGSVDSSQGFEADEFARDRFGDLGPDPQAMGFAGYDTKKHR